MKWRAWGAVAVVLGLLSLVGCGNSTSERLDPGLVAEGKAVAERYGCVACHSLDGSILYGPTWKGLYGSEVVFTDGSKAIADEVYIREAIRDPAARVVAGWQFVMPALSPTSGREIEAILAYIKSLGQEDPPRK